MSPTWDLWRSQRWGTHGKAARRAVIGGTLAMAVTALIGRLSGVSAG